MNQCRWLRKPKNGTSVIFIHGINSSADCWRNKNKSYWPELLEEESELANIGIYIFSYRTGINTGFYSLSDIVDSLKEYFVLDDLISSERVIFVCHSMGGIVARRFLVSQYSTLVEKALNKIGLFLVASPSLGSEYANMLSLISAAMGHTQASALRFSQSNVWLNDLDKDFINLQANKNLQIKGKELIEDLPLYGKGFIKKQVVEPFTGAKYFGNSFKVPGSDHITIAAPADKDRIQHRLLIQFIKEFISENVNSLASMSIDFGHRPVTFVRKVKTSFGDQTLWNPRKRVRFDWTQQFPPYSDDESVSIPRVELDSEATSWFCIEKLNERDGVHMREDFADEGLRLLLEQPWRAFHQGKSSAAKSSDPILDVTFLNDSDRSLLVIGIRTRPLAAWSVPKHIPTPKVIPISNSYTMIVDFTREWSGIDFYDPWLIPSQTAWRFLLRLKDFADSLNVVRANESLLTIGIVTETIQVESGAIYLGTL